MSSSVPKIKERLSIVDVISSYIQVGQSGKNFKAKCPFHNEKTPSFFISPDRGTYYCFGCGEKGDIFSFVEKFEGTDFMGALKLLAERAGVKLEYERTDKDKDKKELYFEILEEATKFFEINFEKDLRPRAYLLSRGITDASIKNFRIGFVKDEWRSLLDYLTNKGYKREDIEIVGLIKKSEKKEKENNFYDRFRSRIMFPISDSSGRVIAFSGRIFGKEDDKEAKYLNSPDTPLFYKSNVLFGIDKAKSSIRTRGYSIVVEGQMDLIMSHQIGFTNTVAVSGTAFTDSIIDNESRINNLGLIRRLSSNIIFAYDGDSAGIRAAGRSSMIALSLDMQVKVASLPEGKDPADIIMDNGDAWKEIIKSAKDIITFHIDRICNNTSDIRGRGKQVRDVIFPFLMMIKSSIEKSSYISLINSKTGIPSNAIIEDFGLYEKSHQTNLNIDSNDNNITLKKKDTISRRDNLEKRLFGIIFWKEKEGKDIDIKEIYKELEERIGEDLFNKICENHTPWKEILAQEAEMWYGDRIKDVPRDLTEIMLSLEEEILNERLILLLDKINQVGNSGDDSDSTLKDYQKVVERIEKIRGYRLQ
ncbi:MAG: DNA primase [Candidatus Paceibacterota bacterium]